MKTLKTVGAISLIAMAVLGTSQDFPGLAGGSARQGVNTGAVLNSAGRAFLTWYAPLINDVDGYKLVRDNNSTQSVITPGWITPTQVDEAPGAFIVQAETPTVRPDIVPIGTEPVRQRINWFENALRGIPFYGVGPIPAGYVAPGSPGYHYSRTVPSAADPKVKLFAADTLNTFTWRIEPPADPSIPNQRYPRNYALSVYINTGPTGDGVGGLLYPQRYYVYQVQYAGGSFVDIVDTFASGNGFVRLGGGGLPTNRMFTYDGVNPITITLFNTVPRRTGHTGDSIPAPYPLNDPRWLNTYPSQPYNTIVCADAVQAIPLSGEYVSTPIVSALDPSILGSPTRVFDARNNYSVGSLNGVDVTTIKATVTSRRSTDGAVDWTYSPLDEGALATALDNSSAGVTGGPAPWFTTAVEPGFLGANYFKAPAVIVAGTEQLVRYAPTLNKGTYQIMAWLPGSRGTEVLARQVVYNVKEGVVTTTVTVDQDAARGWTPIGTRRFTHDPALSPLTVEVTNLSTNPADLGRDVMTDTIKFIGAANLGATSTLVHKVAGVRVTNGGPIVQTPVVLLATEDGKLTCLDATGNGNGTTNVYWTYPSTPDPSVVGWTDPNQVAGEDGPGPTAQMPIAFDLSTALIENIGGNDYLFIASKNGRIYCIDMAGRGDMTLATRQPGTTRRIWSYPNDFPASAVRSRLGAFTGSLAYGVTAAGPTIFAGAPQGRMYALEALPAVITNKTTNVRWTYPALNQPTLGAIQMSPVFEGNRLFFGTGIKSGDDRGRFFSLNADTGAVNWEFNSSALFVNSIPEADAFLSTPVYVDATHVAPGDPSMIVMANENRYIISLEAATGNVLWVTDELGSSVAGGLTVAQVSAFTGGGAGARAPATLIMVPTVDGTFAGLFARIATTNIVGTRLAWRYLAAGDQITASISSGRGFMYGADSAGYIYAFNNLGNGANGDVDGPGAQDLVPNIDDDPDVTDFRDGKLLFVTKDTYQRLRLPDSDANHLTYAQVIGDVTRHVTQLNFDWGETIYALAYDFPYLDTYTKGAIAGQPAPPPIVNYRISVEGASIRNLSIEARRFRNPATAPLAASGARRLDGYACYPYIIQSGGSNAMPPGKAEISFGVATSALTDPPRQVNVTLNPANVTKRFGISNPIALIMNNGPAGISSLFSLGNDYDPSFAENLTNGSVNTGAPGKRQDRMTVVQGYVDHGQANTVQIGIVDRSLMTMLRGEGLGLDNVRVQLSDLEWQGGKAAVHKPIDSIPFYAAFYGTGKGLEDYPGVFPNESDDYPDVDRFNVLVVKDPNGQAENPLFNTVGLNPVTNINLGVSPPTRTLNTTPFDFSLNVPRFQPANTTSAHINSDTNPIAASGFYGSITVFVDSDGNGVHTGARGRREAFRSMKIAAGVRPDERITMDTSTLDFGNLASSTGYDSRDPKTGTTFSPWVGPYAPLFRPVVIYNEGNVNLLNVRLAKTYNGGSPWEIFSATNHELAWLDGNRNLHATFDSQFALTPQPVLPKARPTDSNPTTFRDNPRVRDNPNINAVAGPLLVGSPDPDNPRVAVSLPLGFPSGLYSSIVRAIEDNNFDEDLAATGESYSDPTVTVKFTSREARATNSYTTMTSTMIDDLVPNTAQDFYHANAQPTGMRTPDGHLVTAFTSNRMAGVGAGFNRAQPTANVTNEEWKIYIASVQGAAPAGLPGVNPIRDLNAFVPAAANRWFQRDVAEYPPTPVATLFPGDPVVGATAKFGSPSFPAAGLLNPITGAVHPYAYMAFIGSAQKQGLQERYGDTRIFLAPVTVSATGSTAAGAPIGLPNDPQMSKAAPSVYQLGDDATVFFTALGTGQAQIHYASYNGATWNQTRVLNLGNGFEAVGGPNVSGRVYTGVSGAGQPGTGSSILELAFTGKLRGRPANEIFMTRMAANGVVPGNQYYYPIRTNEFLRTDTEAGTYRASGVVWNPANVTLNYSLNNGPLTNIEVGGTRNTDRTTGLISFETTLGGKAYLDPNLGTVRLSNSLPAKNAALYLTYQPRVLKVSASGTGYSGATMLFDNRLIGELSYWADSATNAAILPNDPVRSSRYVLTYSRSAAGNGQTARPYMQTFRLGVQLPYDVATTANGNIVAINVTGATGFYQVDPANGRIYFTDVDENRNITVTFTGLDDAGNQVAVAATNYTVGLMTERGEIPVLMDQTVNESQMYTFLDPFDISSPGGARRPGLIWTLWTSTRTGTPDIFFQTIAPRFTPVGRQ
ncbi:MAG: PQQ-binding-like beta-propeller repeat protein [Fimbriimonadaceae bacterium]